MTLTSTLRLKRIIEDVCLTSVLLLERPFNVGDCIKVRKTPSWPRSWANVSLLQLYYHMNAWANLHLFGRPET
jgi:hypothetical protein